MANNSKLTEQEKQKLIELIQQGKPIPSHFEAKLFDNGDSEFIEVTKDYKLVYKGKEPKEKIIANTPAAPLQLVRSFNSDNKFDDGWHNMLIFGDNLLALKTIYNDQRGENKYKTKNKIKLIYIDPPFATKQDFMKDREKAYRDKIIGAQFIEFLRKRLILLYEILADDGSIYIHLDEKKGHYIKTIIDEIFGEHNFKNSIAWKRTSAHSDSGKYGSNTDHIYFYTKSDVYIWNQQYENYSDEYLKRFSRIDDNGRRWTDGPLTAKGLKGRGYNYSYKGINGYWRCPPETMKKLDAADLLYFTSKGGIRVKKYLDEMKGIPIQSSWTDIFPTNSQAAERIDYPTQKPEDLIKRIILSSSNKDDIIIDTFVGSGTTLAVAEKLGRRWIGIDSGKLAIYTVQKRLLNLTSQIGGAKTDDRLEYERTKNFSSSLKASRGLFLVTEKARKGDLIISDSFLKSFAEFIQEYLSGNSEEYVSLCIPEDKLKIQKLVAFQNDEDSDGDLTIKVDRINFLISFIQPKEKRDKGKKLGAREFTLYNAGIYDNREILNLNWSTYKPFVSQLFGLRNEEHKIHGFIADGYIGTYSAYVWNYPEHKNLTLDTEYVKTLHTVLGNKAGEKFYVIAPVTAMAFMEDEVKFGDTNYVFLKVPLSVLKALIEKGEPGSLRQPTSETDINEVIDAVGFDFISQPIVKAKYFRDAPLNPTLEDHDKLDFVIEIDEFKSNTLVYDPEDFENFETLSMVMIDNDYNDDYFNLSQVYWSDKIIKEDKTKALIRIPQDSFEGERMMVIYMDKYGNELKIVKTKEEFDAPRIQKRRSASKAKRRRKK
ncbi:MAG: site-specific DNA-methyltransferase [Ignavibacteriaceae bacterium]|jgi:site-specific DNA-methyltransferase (adenine-specific)/adenine-specific DNA-methyltransferase|nr:site-specific DNA-methyltransferase [Ignavibacteriaceae bacterium]